MTAPICLRKLPADGTEAKYLVENLHLLHKEDPAKGLELTGRLYEHQKRWGIAPFSEHIEISAEDAQETKEGLTFRLVAHITNQIGIGWNFLLVNAPFGMHTVEVYRSLFQLACNGSNATQRDEEMYKKAAAV